MDVVEHESCHCQSGQAARARLSLDPMIPLSFGKWIFVNSRLPTSSLSVPNLERALSRRSTVDEGRPPDSHLASRCDFDRPRTAWPANRLEGLADLSEGDVALLRGGFAPRFFGDVVQRQDAGQMTAGINDR